jgi:hypothetical protein
LSPDVVRALEKIERKQEAHDVALERLQRDDEHNPMILRRLTELERLMRGDPGLAKPTRHTRARPLGVDR